MVLGLKTKTRKGKSVELDYNVHVQEIKPWPPCEALKSVESVLLQWENGDQINGIFKSGIFDGKITFNESFRLPLTLCREGKSKTRESFQKNYLEFHLYESRKDLTVKGQHIGSAIVNIADYGIIKEITSIYAPLNCKKSFKSTIQPVLFIKVHSFETDGSRSASEVMSEENYEDTEMSSITDDDDDDRDISLRSTRTSSASEASSGLIYRSEENGKETAKIAAAKSEAVSDDSSLSKFPEKTVMPTREKFSIKSASIALGFLGITSNHASSGVSQPSGVDDIKPPRVSTSIQKDIITDKEVISQTQEVGTKKPVSLRSDTLPPINRVNGSAGSSKTTNKLHHMKSIVIPSDSTKISRLSSNNKFFDKIKIVDSQEKVIDDSKAQLESRVEMLEEELRESAAIEIGLYSVVAEHGSSINKVHAPARRLSRFYLHSCKAESQAKQASAARAVVSGIVLVSKACGNDVPRLDFWLSNVIVLRGIVSKAAEEFPFSTESRNKSNGGKNEMNKKVPMKKNKHTSSEKEQNNSLESSTDDWEDPEMFTAALEKIEAWIFSRIVESVWWQTLTPHMQSAAAKDSSKKINVKRNGLAGQGGQVNFSIDLWKKALKDAYERLCPIRSGGHECGCLPVPSRLVMEHLVDRLDVAMFNAILRESAEEMPTDPVSDPISDSRVLPIPAGKSGFGAGVQLKNAVGNWSRWLTNLFGIDDDCSENGNNPDVDKRSEKETSFKPFHLLNALSDLMMLPFEMLADKSTRKEVCPYFGSSEIKRVLYNFVPDEFSPQPIPKSVFEALDSEDSLENMKESRSTFPVTAPPPLYSPPTTASLAVMIGEIGGSHVANSKNRGGSSSSSILKKSYTSDDELDELDSPLTLIVKGKTLVSATSPGISWNINSKGGRKVVRYDLLRETWTTEK